ncbi:hypothetical protein UlMin_028455 [Ulmus minor]
MEELSMDDPIQLLEAALEFANYPGVQTDAAAEKFLDRFPLPVLLNVLQVQSDMPGLDNALVASLEKIFKTNYGASLIPQYMPFVQVGLKADSQIVKGLACKTVTCLLDSWDEDEVTAVQLVIDYDVYPLLLDCLENGNEQVAAAAIEAITKFACFPQGMEIVFPTNTNEATHLGALAARCSSLGRVRVLSLIVKLYSISSSVASVIYKSNLLGLFEAEIKNTNDTLATLSVLELLYELSEIPHGREFMSGNILLQLLSSIISNKSIEPILRSRAMMISGRLLRDNYMFVDESSIKTVISAIDGVLALSETQDIDECETALEALGQIGSSVQGAQLLLSSSPPAARHVVDAAFDRQGRGKQLAALHALGNISGESRNENMTLNSSGEESLRQLIYKTASRTSKLTPSGLVLSILQQDAEVRLAGYRVIKGLVARTWFLIEICSKHEIINIITNLNTENTKIGMDARYDCCKAIQKAFMMSSKVSSDPSLSGLAAKVHEAVQMGPYGARKLEPQPQVMTADRF